LGAQRDGKAQSNLGPFRNMNLNPVAQKALVAVAAGAVAYFAWKCLSQGSVDAKVEKKQSATVNSSCSQPKMKTKRVVLLELYHIELLESLVAVCMLRVS
jgi:hypothetical protein